MKIPIINSTVITGRLSYRIFAAIACAWDDG
jgi:hypothetical protein